MYNTFQAKNGIFETGAEFRFFSFAFFENKEFSFTPSPEEFLKNYAPNRVEVLRSALRKIKFKFKGEFITNLLMPSNIGGYFSPDKNVLAISPYILLHGSEEEITHVLFHEGLHAGIYTNGQRIMEEVVVETMTKKKMEEIYGKSKFQSGYDSLVKEASKFFGDKSFKDLSEKIEEKDDLATFNNYLELAVLNDLEDLSYQSIYKNLGKQWKVLKKLFPRMINSIAKNNKGLHEEASMNVYDYKLEGLLEKSAMRIISEKPWELTEIFNELTDKGSKNMSLEEITNGMFRKGFGYIYDYDSEIVEREIYNYLTTNTVKNFTVPIKLIPLSI